MKEEEGNPAMPNTASVAQEREEISFSKRYKTRR
jgi:hypothetical protein